ncbi:hypothetical protein D3C78_1506060 [compost metagenome]
MQPLTYAFSPTGTVICRNHKGLIFYLQGEVPSRLAAAQPAERKHQAGPEGAGLVLN